MSNSSGTMDCSLPGSSVLGILQVRILEWVAISFSRESSWPRNQTKFSCIAGRFFTIWATREALAKVNFEFFPRQAFLTGSSVHGILQARILEWVAISFSRWSSRPRDRTQISRIAGRFFTIWATRKAHFNKLAVFNCICKKNRFCSFKGKQNKFHFN